jgi:hypothetical protein
VIICAVWACIRVCFSGYVMELSDILLTLIVNTYAIPGANASIVPDTISASGYVISRRFHMHMYHALMPGEVNIHGINIMKNISISERLK